MTKRTLTLLAAGVTGILSVALLASAACSPFAAAPTPTPTKTPKPTFTPTFTATPTPKATATPTWTLVPSPTPRPPTKVPTATLKPTLPPPPPPTATPTPAATATPSLPYSIAYGRSEQNCGITDVRGTVWDASNNKKNGVVIWLSDESGNYKGFSYGPNGATGEDSAVGDGMYRITMGGGLQGQLLDRTPRAESQILYQ